MSPSEPGDEPGINNTKVMSKVNESTRIRAASAVSLLSQGKSYSEVKKTMNISKSTLTRYIKLHSSSSGRINDAHPRDRHGRFSRSRSPLSKSRSRSPRQRSIAPPSRRKDTITPAQTIDALLVTANETIEKQQHVKTQQKGPKNGNITD